MTEGTNYDDEYPTCRRTSAALRVFSQGLDPSAISELLQVEPTSTHRVGDSVGEGGGGSRASHGWFLSSEGATASRDARRHIDWLLDVVDETGISVLTRADATTVDIFVFWESESGHGGPLLSPPQMHRLARLGLTVGFDVHFAR